MKVKLVVAMLFLAVGRVAHIRLLLANVGMQERSYPRLLNLPSVFLNARKQLLMKPAPGQAKILANSSQPSDSTPNRVSPKVRECRANFAILKVEPNAGFSPTPILQLTLLFSNFCREI
jgi:hypothetical protein